MKSLDLTEVAMSWQITHKTIVTQDFWESQKISLHLEKSKYFNTNAICKDIEDLQLMNYLINVSLGCTELQNYIKLHNNFYSQQQFHLCMRMFWFVSRNMPKYLKHIVLWLMFCAWFCKHCPFQPQQRSQGWFTPSVYDYRVGTVNFP